MFKSTYGTMYYVDSMKDAVKYYTGTLGAMATYESDEWTEFDIGGHRICLHNKRAGEKYNSNGVLIFNYEGTKGLFDKMKSEGVKVFGLHEVHPGNFSFTVADNSGNELSVFGPG